MHYPGHLRDAFVLWIEMGRPDTATVEIDYVLQERPATELIGRMWHCDDIMPRDYCELVDMPPASTYAAVAQALRR